MGRTQSLMHGIDADGRGYRMSGLPVKILGGLMATGATAGAAHGVARWAWDDNPIQPDKIRRWALIHSVTNDALRGSVGLLWVHRCRFLSAPAPTQK